MFKTITKLALIGAIAIQTNAFAGGVSLTTNWNPTNLFVKATNGTITKGKIILTSTHPNPAHIGTITTTSRLTYTTNTLSPLGINMPNFSHIGYITTSVMGYTIDLRNNTSIETITGSFKLNNTMFNNDYFNGTMPFRIETQAPKPFITEWDLSKISYPNEERNDVISFGVGTTTGVVSYQWETIPATISGTGTFTGTVASITGLPADAKIRLSIDPQNFNRFYTWYFNPEAGEERIFDSPRKLINVAQWGDVAWSDMFGAFYECANMEMTATDVPNLSGVTDMGYMFYEARIFNGSIGGWNVGNVKNMFSTFQYARAFNQPIGNWNTANVEDMTAMFINAEAFNQPLSNWNTAKVAQMGQMFSDAYAFNQPIGNWNIGQVVRMENMFYNATAFNQSLGGWGAVLNPSVNLTGLLDNTPLSVANYDATLQGFASGTVTGRNLRAFGVKYCNKATRDVLTGTARNWTITGDGGLTPTTFITQPKSVATCAGLSAMFNVSATGITPLTYLWNTGANTTSISANAPQNYQVTVTGGCGVAISTVAGFSTLAGTAIVTQPISQFIQPNATTSLSVSATGANLMFLWSSNETVSGITGKAVGIYKVTVSGACGSVVSNGATIVGLAVSSASVLGISTPSNVITITSPVTITINGTGFAQGATVTVNGVALNVITVTSNEIIATLPVGVVTSTSAVNVQVANPNQAASVSVSIVPIDKTATSTNLPAYQSTSFSIFPNPTSNGDFKIESPLTTERGIVEIFNAQGSVVYTQNILSAKADGYTLQINANLTSGIYLVKVGTASVKLVVY